MNKTDNYIFIKIILAAFFLLILNSWLAYHIGEDFLETYFVNGILVFFAIVSFFLKYLRRGEEEKFNQLYSNWLAGLLSFQVIAGFYILFFMAGCFVSSIQISSNKTQTNILLNLFSPGNSDTSVTQFEISEMNPVSKKTVFTVPFGRSFILDSKGYQQLEFQVYPWTGKKIILENDLQVSPTIIARIPVDHFIQLSRAKLIVHLNNHSVDTFNLDRHATIILGQISEIPEEYCNRWLAELKGTYEKDVTIYSYLNKWCAEEPLFILNDLIPFDSIKMELTNKEGVQFAICKGIVDTSKFKELKFKSLPQ